MVPRPSLINQAITDENENYSKSNPRSYCLHAMLMMAADELDLMRSAEAPGYPGERLFPPACLMMVKNLPGNSQCVDCGAYDPEWASVSYGVLFCLHCSGRHRSLGVKNSFVRSIEMDTWSRPQITAMLEGGNEQMNSFFSRHALTRSSSSLLPQDKRDLVEKRYNTKAALFYRENLARHVDEVVSFGRYRGREVARRRTKIVRRRNITFRMSTIERTEEVKISC